MAQTIHTSTEYQSVGRPTPRKDAPEKVTGQARFAGDLPMAGLLHARLVLSPYAHARILQIDTSAALAIPGVVVVYTSETLGMAKRNSTSRTQSPLAKDEALWAGHPVAIVLAETEAAAEDGAAVVDVDYEELPVVIDPVAAMQPGSPLARHRGTGESSEIAGGGAHAAVAEEEEEDTEKENLSENVSDRIHYHVGDIEAGWREAEVVVEHTYRTSFVHQSYLEPQSMTVVPSVTGDHITLYPSTQAMFGVRGEVAQALDVPQRQVRVESVPVGGGFGGKFGLSEPLGAAAAFAARRPVRLVYTRSEDLLAGNPAPQSIITLKMGAKRDGTLVAMQATIIFDSGCYGGSAVGLSGFLLASSYRCPNIDFHCYEVLTNKVSVGAYRAPGAPQATFALESTVDELCRELGIDPADFRLKNAL
ncbi:MAG TPA: molybdopterin cofactor-binding domain-containing protein, partial [Ktedonobacteraceae bacterium]|nr:molybdopterin cofactor-binding domain-containing protein [Ktedonobacteraceae bacterium]